MGYGASARGDYGGSYGRGDPFLGGLLGGAFKFVKGAIKGGISSVTGGGRPSLPAPGGMRMPALPFQAGAKKVPGIKGKVQRFLPGGETGYYVTRSRRMNVANPKALRRAIRRQAGFVKLAKRALKGSGYTIVSRGSRRPKMIVKESGPGSVSVQ